MRLLLSPVVLGAALWTVAVCAMEIHRRRYFGRGEVWSPEGALGDQHDRAASTAITIDLQADESEWTWTVRQGPLVVASGSATSGDLGREIALAEIHKSSEIDLGDDADLPPWDPSGHSITSSKA